MLDKLTIIPCVLKAVFLPQQQFYGRRRRHCLTGQPSTDLPRLGEGPRTRWRSRGGSYMKIVRFRLLIAVDIGFRLYVLVCSG